MEENSPVLEFNKWLAYTNWASHHNKDLKSWRKQYNIGDNGHGYSEKAFEAWAAKADERSSTLSTYIRKNCLSLGLNYSNFKISREHRIPKKPRIYGLDCRYLGDLRS